MKRPGVYLKLFLFCSTKNVSFLKQGDTKQSFSWPSQPPLPLTSPLFFLAECVALMLWQKKKIALLVNTCRKHSSKTTWAKAMQEDKYNI